MIFNVSQFIQIFAIKRFFVNIIAFEMTFKQFVFCFYRDQNILCYPWFITKFFSLLDIWVNGACLWSMDLKIEVRL